MSDVTLNILKKRVSVGVGVNITGGSGDSLMRYVGVNNPDGVTFSDNGDGTCTIGDAEVYLHTSSDYTGTINSYTLAGGVFSIPDHTERYICAKYDTGTEAAYLYLESDPAQINGSNVTLVYVLWREGAYIHSISSGSVGLGLPNKLNSRVINTEPYKLSIDGGLLVSEYGTRNIAVSPATVYAASNPVHVFSMTSVADRMLQVYKSGATTYDYTQVTSYDNSNRADETGGALIPLSNNKYGNRFYFRSIGDDKEVFCVIGYNEYNALGDALLENPPTDIPDLLKKHCVFVGRSTIEKNAASGITVSVSNVSYNYLDVSGLFGLQQIYYQDAEPDISQDNILWATLGGGLFISQDSGASWAQLPIPVLGDVNSFSSLNIFESGVQCYLNGHVYFSSTGGDTVDDIRLSNDNGRVVWEICTVAGLTKGSGTWIETSFNYLSEDYMWIGDQNDRPSEIATGNSIVLRGALISGQHTFYKSEGDADGGFNSSCIATITPSIIGTLTGQLKYDFSTSGECQVTSRDTANAIITSDTCEFSIVIYY